MESRFKLSLQAYLVLTSALTNKPLINLVELLRTAQDIPEDLLVDFLEVISKPGLNKHG